MEDPRKVVSMDEKEFQAAQEAAAKAKDTFVLKFKKPFVYNGVEYSELEFDFEGLTGNDSLEVERELTRRGINIIAPAFSIEYIVRIAARACTSPIGHDAMSLMTIRDFNRIRSAVRNFLMGSEQ